MEHEKNKNSTFNRREFLTATASLAGLGLMAGQGGLIRLAEATDLISPNLASEFPPGFTWGASAASYQIEGAASEEGRGPSVWDMFSKKPGATWEGQTGEVAADHYHRYREDVALMKQIGLQAYRLSIAWPRVLPDGIGEVNVKGLAFYDRLIDELLKADIKPYVTLFHWDLPLARYQKGGWLNRDSADWFCEYTQVVTRKLGDRVKHWITLNEPTIFLGHGMQFGIHAPGDRLSFPEVLKAGHHVLLAHGKSVQVIRANVKDSKVGFALVGYGKVPVSSSPADIAAARAATFAIPDKTPHNNTWWMDPMFFGHYPEEGLKFYGDDAPKIQAGDMETIRQALDFMGLNIYTADYVRAGANGQSEIVPFPIGHPVTASEFQIVPQSLYWTPKFLHERYQKPIYITENGFSSWDMVSLDGKVHDPQRIDATARYLIELGKAAKEGIPVRGYFHWSIMDNFEWAQGYKQRFGMIYVDYPTQRRILKDSAYWYKDIIASNGGQLSALAKNVG